MYNFYKVIWGHFILWMFLMISFCLVYTWICYIPSKEPFYSGTFPQVVFFDNLNIKLKDKSLLDVGCGVGGLVYFLSNTSGIKNIFGIDKEEVIKLATEKYPDHKDNFRVGVAEDIPLLDESVDVIIFQYSLHHVDNYELALSEIGRVLRWGGYVIFLEPVTNYGRYESHELAKFLFGEENEEKDFATNLIHRGASKYHLKNTGLEKFFVFQIGASVLVESARLLEPEKFEDGYPKMMEYLTQIALEDSVVAPDLKFFSTTRLNIWKKTLL